MKNIEMVKLFPSEKEAKDDQKVIKLDYNLHSEKLLFIVDEHNKKTKKEVSK